MVEGGEGDGHSGERHDGGRKGEGHGGDMVKGRIEGGRRIALNVLHVMSHSHFLIIASSYKQVILED